MRTRDAEGFCFDRGKRTEKYMNQKIRSSEPKQEKRGEYKMTVHKSITFVKGCGSYKAGDGLQLDGADAVTFVNAGYAVYSEERHEGE